MAHVQAVSGDLALAGLTGRPEGLRFRAVWLVRRAEEAA